MNKTILVPVPHYGFDPTESAIPWKMLKAAGAHVVFSTPDGKTAAADRRMLTGEGLPTYPVPMADELASYLESPKDFYRGLGVPIPIRRDSAENFNPGFAMLDGNYLSARWPGDAHRFGYEFKRMISHCPV